MVECLSSSTRPVTTAIICTLFFVISASSHAERGKTAATSREQRGLAFASDHPALSQIEPTYLEQLFSSYVGPERARSPEWKAQGLKAKMKEAHGVATSKLQQQFGTQEALDYARSIMNQSRVVKMTSMEIAEPMMKAIVLKSPTEKGIVEGKHHHPKEAHTEVMKDLFGLPTSTISRSFRDQHYPRYGYLHFDGLGKRKFLHGFTSDGYDTYGELMWIYKNDRASRAQTTITAVDSGNNHGLGLPFSRAFVDFQLAELAAAIQQKPKVVTTRQDVVHLFRELSAPQSEELGMPEGQAYTGNPQHLEAVAIRDFRLFENSDAMPYGFVESLRRQGIKFYVIKTDPAVHSLYEPTKSSQRSQWVEVRSSKQLYRKFMDQDLARQGSYGRQFLKASGKTTVRPRVKQPGARKTLVPRRRF